MPWSQWKENDCRGHGTYPTYESSIYKCKHLSKRELFSFIKVQVHSWVEALNDTWRSDTIKRDLNNKNQKITTFLFLG
ncbi:hypothetical protein GW17_00048242 [Ensete ventricosum]|nr:hypothetical protein GW17_00048242 [Ensete ventricosum]RZS12110.1 hypothetical protein BHM03_00043503 [Ensete ventricosum]